MPGKIFSFDRDCIGLAAASSSPVVDTAVPAASLLDTYDNDPFFKRHLSSKWNACIGKQGDEENYLDGYMEAAIELAEVVIDKKMYAKRDTLVLPILYNARHAVELALKFVTDRLVVAGLIPRAGARNHNINAYWLRLDGAGLGDEKLSETLQKLKPFIDSLSRVDNDGQELRYHLNRFDDPSLSDYSLANLEVIRSSLTELSEILSVLRWRTLGHIDEHATGTFTSRCSRRDLLTIAQLMPPRDSWNSPLFDEQKAAIKARFNLSNKQFSKALDVIQSNREMKATLGVESDLLYISDDEIIWLVEQWRRLHPQRNKDDGIFGIKTYGPADMEAMFEQMALEKEVIDEVEKRITADQLAAVEAMFYLARDRIFPEYHERFVEMTQKKYAAADDYKEKIDHLISKTNFLQCLQVAASKLGRLSLADRLSNM